MDIKKISAIYIQTWVRYRLLIKKMNKFELNYTKMFITNKRLKEELFRKERIIIDQLRKINNIEKVLNLNNDENSFITYPLPHVLDYEE